MINRIKIILDISTILVICSLYSNLNASNELAPSYHNEVWEYLNLSLYVSYPKNARDLLESGFKTKSQDIRMRKYWPMIDDLIKTF